MENLQLSRQHFISLAYNMNRSEFPNVDPLYRFLFGASSVQTIFFRLMAWLPKSQRDDGAVYKSAAELGYETGFSARTVERAHKMLEMLGFRTFIKKANGTPTNHYVFDSKKFFQYVADKLKVTVEQIRKWMGIAEAGKQAGDKMSESGVHRNLDSATMSESGAKSDPPSETVAETVPTNWRSEVRNDGGLDSDIVSATLTKIETTEEPNNKKETPTQTPSEYELRQKYLEAKGFRYGCSPEHLKKEIYRLHLLIPATHSQIEGWINEYGFRRVNNVMTYAAKNPQKVRKPLSWVTSALKNKYELPKDWMMVSNSLDYSAGPYSAFVLT